MPRRRRGIFTVKTTLRKDALKRKRQRSSALLRELKKGFINARNSPMSQPNEEQDGNSSLPFLQFKNGGIRVNFAGYHAEAGLGGLLGGSDAKGGLFASAGTPWGPSASAGLGGGVDGQEGRARGGLHARAGLGNGGPEAAAGLGGSVDGSAQPGGRARGGLFAGATAGGPVQAAAGLGGSVDGSGAPNSRTGGAFAGATDGRRTHVVSKEVSNIQPIEPTEKGSTTLEFKVPGLEAKREVSSIVTRDVGNPGSKYDAAGANGVVAATDAQGMTDVTHPARRSYRKRLREGNPFRKNFYKFVKTNLITPVLPAASDSANIESGRAEPQVIDNRWDADDFAYVPYGTVTRPKGTTFFDDIFNIPISTLMAVNQLLNNKSG